MPLHDWNKADYWEGVHGYWVTDLARWIKQRLPAGYRAYLGSTPAVAVGPAIVERPDVSVRRATDDDADPPVASADSVQPDVQIATVTLDPQTGIFVERDGW